MTIVSIIVPVYRVEAYLDKCITSIQSQTFEEWELILVDDGSPDRSGIICDKYAGKDSRIKVIHKKNEGVSKARNTGLDVAIGNFICFVDSDDWVEPTYIESLLRYAGNEQSVIYGNVIHDYSDARASIKAFNYVDDHVIPIENNMADLVVYRIPENGFPIAKLFCKSVIDRWSIRFDESLSYHEDHIFVLEYLAHANSVVLSGKADYHYMHREGNFSLSKKKHSANKLVDASSKLISAIESGNERWNISDLKYLKRLYTYLGLNQLMLALSGATSSELPFVSKAIRDNSCLFRRFYSPNHNLFRLVPFFIKLRFDIIYRMVLKWKEKFT